MFSLGISLFELFSGQILASPHHVFAITSARLARDTTWGRMHSLGYDIDYEDTTIAETLLDMHLRGVRRRPSVSTVRGRLMAYLDRLGVADDD